MEKPTIILKLEKNLEVIQSNVLLFSDKKLRPKEVE